MAVFGFWAGALDAGVGMKERKHPSNPILSSFHKTRALEAARTSLGVDPVSVPDKKPRAERVRDLLQKHLGRSLTDCPDCGTVDSLVRILLPPHARAPLAGFVYAPVK